MSAAAADLRTAKLHEVEAVIRAGDIAGATELARSALGEGIEHPLLLNLRAFWHENQGSLEASLSDLVRANALAPRDVPILNALGLAYARLGKMAEAVKAFDGAIAEEPSFWHAHYNKGWASEELGELEAARQGYERAAALAPNAPDPVARQASLAARLGEWDVARAQADRALAMFPGQSTAIAARASVELADKDFEAAEKRLRALLADPQHAPSVHANALGLLGDVLDGQDRTAEAFDAYTRANALLRRIHQARFEGPGVETIPQCLGWMTRTFEALSPGQWIKAGAEMPGGEEPARHIFLLGFPRSGTTLLEEIFASHPQSVTTQERDALADSIREFLSDPSGIERLAALRGAGLARYRRSYWRGLRGFGIESKAKTLIDKQPYNTIKLPLIGKLFPAAKIVFSIRDPRDVVLSCFRRRFRMNPSAFEFLTLEGAARFYDATMRLAEIYRAKLPLDLHALRHEDLVEDFERHMKAVCEFAGVPWTGEMHNFAGRPGARAIATPSAPQVSRGLNSEGIGQWRRYREQLAPILPILEPWVERFGYKAD